MNSRPNTFYNHFLRLFFNKKYQRIWPRPITENKLNTHFLFILTLPNSGSTALAKLLDSSPFTGTLTNNAEGQWLIPGMCKEDRWNNNKYVDYKSVFSVWSTKTQRLLSKNPDLEVIIEKSPPNMMRIEKLIDFFSNYSLLANNRNPYAYCASLLYRYHDGENLESFERLEKINDAALEWISKSRTLKSAAIKFKIPVITYEDFCKSPASIICNLNIPENVKNSINFDSNVLVKDYSAQKIENKNEEQISKLTRSEIETVTTLLQPESTLLEYFGYSFIK